MTKLFKKNIFKIKNHNQSDASIYFVIYGASVLIALIKTLYIASVLVPEQMGSFVSLSLISALIIYISNFGVMDAYLIRTRSIQRGEVSAWLLRGQLYYFVLMMSTITTTVIFCFGYLYISQDDHLPDLVLAAIYLFLQPLQAASLIDLQSDKKLIKYSSYTLIKSAAPLMMVAIMQRINLLYVNINFILLCEVVTTTILVGITVSGYRNKIVIKPRIRLINKLIRQGILFTGQAVLNNLTSNLDKWFVVTIFGLASAGAYSISNQIILVGAAIGGMLTTYLIPNMTFSTANKSQVIKRLNKLSSGIIVAGMVIGILFVYISWERVVNYYSQYQLSFEIFAITCVTMSFIGANLYEVFFRAVNAGGLYFFIQLSANLLMIILLLFVYFFKLDLYWVAISIMIAKIFTWTTCRTIATLHYDKP